MQDGDFTAHFRTTGHAEIDAMIAVYNRMIDALRDERARGREQEGFVKKLIAASPSGVLTLDHDGKISLINAAADRFLEAPAGFVLGRLLDTVELPLARALAELPPGGSDVVTLHGRLTLALRCERGHLALEIADSGPGLVEAARGRLFTPFFSTKRDGRGLGLTIVREILVQHRFEFDLDNAVGGGVVFRLRC